MKDNYIGKGGTTERYNYEYELRMGALGKMIKTTRNLREIITLMNKIIELKCIDGYRDER